MNKEQQEGKFMPVSRLHYSALTQLLGNPFIFKLKYIFEVYDGTIGVSTMIGRAAHKALRAYYGGDPDHPVFGEKPDMQAMAFDVGMEYITQFADSIVDFGKTGSMEQLMKGYAQALRFYWAEEPEYNEIILCEEKLEGEMKTKDGQMLPLPGVGVPDIVHKRKDGGIEIIDFKFVKKHTDWESENYIKIIQSQFLWHLLKEVKGWEADRMIFLEVKISENSRENKGQPQLQPYVIPYDHEQYRVIFYNIYKDVCKFLSIKDQVYLPNLRDPMDGEQSGLLYAQGLMSADMSDVEVMHRVKEVALTSKRFVSSRLERIENKHLPPQERIKVKLAEFGIPVEPEEVKVGASITQYRFKVSAGVRMSAFEKHKQDIARAIEAKGEIKILAPIPGTGLVGVEVPNDTRTNMTLDKKYFVPNTLTIPVGVDVHGHAEQVPLNEMPHLLIAGASGSGKSILLHSILTALTKQMAPEDMQLVLIDPKRVELVAFAKVKHLKGGKIIYQYEEAMLALKTLKAEMERRYKTLEEAKCRDIGEYNEKAEAGLGMPYIVLVIDEFANLILEGKEIERSKKRKKSMLNAARRVEIEATARQFAKMGMTYVPKVDEEEDPAADELIARLAAMARATGIHLIIATQRPSVDVITGLIKANFPTRIALTTASPTDSTVILGEPGAEKLSGKGDMIFVHPGGGKKRLQGFMIEAKEKPKKDK